MPPTLTKDEIAAGALAIIDDLGPDRVTARALGSALHVAPATLYTVFDSLEEVDAATRTLLLEQLAPVLDEVARSGSLDAFLQWSVTARNAGLFLSDPTHPRLELASRLFPEVNDLDQVADLQALVHSTLASPPSSGDLDSQLDSLKVSTSVLVDLYLETVAGGDEVLVELPELPATPSLAEMARAVIRESDATARSKLVRQFGVDLILAEGLDGWAFRRIVQESGIPLTTLHRLGSRLVHLQQAYADLSDAAWRRAGLAGGGAAVKVGVAARELLVTEVPSLMGLLRRPAAAGDALGPLLRLDLRSSLAPTAAVVPARDLLSGLGALIVSRYSRRVEAPDPWARAPELVAKMVARWQG